jgi:hypothetical protein
VKNPCFIISIIRLITSRPEELFSHHNSMSSITTTLFSGSLLKTLLKAPFISRAFFKVFLKTSGFIEPVNGALT